MKKSRGPQQNIGAYAPGPLGKSNPGQGCLPGVFFRGFPCLDLAELGVGEIHVEGQLRDPDAQVQEGRVPTVLGNDMDVVRALCLLTIQVDITAMLVNLQGKKLPSQYCIQL